jgi:hypothetical protein
METLLVMGSQIQNFKHWNFSTTGVNFCVPAQHEKITSLFKRMTQLLLVNPTE